MEITIIKADRVTALLHQCTRGQPVGIRGPGNRMPYIFATCMIAAVSISGISPLNGFVSKWMVYQGAIESCKTSWWGYNGDNGVSWWVWGF